MKHDMNKALFLDRDGVLIKMCYNQKWGIVDIAKNANDVKLQPDIITVIKSAKEKGYKVIVISNQPVIALRKTTLANFSAVRERMRKLLQKSQVALDDEYYCLHHPYADTAYYRKKCECRKPAPGMLLRAIKEHNLDPSRCWFIGDGVNDVVAGVNAGCRTVLLGNIIEAEYLRIIEKELKGYKPDLFVKNLHDFIPFL